jgi:hypothetical protein
MDDVCTYDKCSLDAESFVLVLGGLVIVHLVVISSFFSDW